MSTYLYRLGAMAFDHRRAMLAAWLAVFVGVIAAAFAFSGKTNNSFTVPGTESQQAQELLEQKFPAASGAYARMVFEAPEGTTLDDPEVQAAVMASVEQAGTGAEVIGVVDPYTAGTISADGTIGFADVRYPVSASDIQSESKDQLEASAEPAEAAGLQVEWAGGVVKTESHSAAEAIGIAVGFLVLAITLTSLLAAGLPLLSAIFGVVIGIMGLTAVTGLVEVSDTAPTLATMLGLAVGIDYALFILSRHRQGLHDGLTPRESTAQSIATAGSAVVFAGMTVIIALVGLLVVNIPFLTVMGLAAAGTVAIAVLIAITLLPALFGFFGQRLRPHQPRARLQRPAPRPREPERSAPAGPGWSPAARCCSSAARPRPHAHHRHPGDAHEARPAGRRLAADQHHRAEGVRPADRGLRPRLQRPADPGHRGHGRDARGAGRRSRARSSPAWRARPASPPCPTPCRTRRAT